MTANEKTRQMDAVTEMLEAGKQTLTERLKTALDLLHETENALHDCLKNRSGLGNTKDLIATREALQKEIRAIRKESNYNEADDDLFDFAV